MAFDIPGSWQDQSKSADLHRKAAICDMQHISDIKYYILSESHFSPEQNKPIHIDRVKGWQVMAVKMM